MDKSTLSNYGWVVIAVLVISVMIALATPFGSFVAKGTTATVNSLTETISKSMGIDSADLGQLTINGITETQNNGNSAPTITEVITNYSIEEIEANDKLLAIGKTKPEYVVAEFNDNYTSVTITKNGSDSDGLMRDWDDIVSPHFSEYKNLRELTVCDGMKSIGDIAFTVCSLTKIDLGNTVERIGWGSFSETNITHITIPSSVKVLGEEAFSYSPNLERVNLTEGLEEIGVYAFLRCKKLTTISLPNSLTSIKAGAFAECSSLENIKIPASIKELDGTFNSCTSLKNVILPDTLETIGQATFIRCSSLETIDIPNTVKTIGSLAFYDCDSLKDIKLPDNLEVIGTRAFYHCNGFSKVVIPNKVTKIETSAFRECYSLTELYLPASITTIEKEALYGASSNTEPFTIYCETQAVADLLSTEIYHSSETPTIIVDATKF